MGATKIDHYDSQIIRNATIANALGHPARLTILEAIRENTIVRSKDLEGILKLSKHAVHNHVQRLTRAGIVELEFYPNEYHLRINNHIDFPLEVLLRN